MKTFTAGRNPSADICLGSVPEAATISDLHADITAAGDGATFLVVDRGSTNGTYVWTGKAWEKISQKAVLADTPISLGQFRSTPRNLLRK